MSVDYTKKKYKTNSYPVNNYHMLFSEMNLRVWRKEMEQESMLQPTATLQHNGRN